MKFSSAIHVLFIQLSSCVAAQPNIIVMQPDDLKFYDDWGAPPNNPSEPSKTVDIPSDGLPNMEYLRLNGVQMMQAYTVSPMCGTSRYSTITGKYPSRAASSRRANSNQNQDISEVTIPTTKLVDNNSQNDCTEENLAVTFKNNGYRTGMIGKWHLTRVRNMNYTESQQTVMGCGFDYVDALFMENLRSEGDPYSHNMEWVTYEAINFINDDSEQPFFLYFNPTVPHGSNDVYTALTEFSCRDVVSGTLDSDPLIDGMTLEYGNCEDYRQSVIDRAANDDELGPIWVDDGIGAILQALESKGILDNTIFLFQQDHGMETKGAIFENGNRIAQFIHYPNEISAGTKLNVPVATIDIGPTLLDYAGISASYSMDGTSWRDAMSDPVFESYLSNDRCLFFEIEKDRAVRCGCSKLLSIYDSNSTTYTRGEQYGYSTELDFDNVFDLCGNTTEYITDPTTNMEETNLFSVDTERDTLLADRLTCHLARTNYSSDPDFSDCSNPTVYPTTAPTFVPTPKSSPKPTTNPSSQPSSQPTSSSTNLTNCDDSTLRFRLTWNDKTIARSCSWVANRATKQRCAVEGVSAMCAKTCDSCSICADSNNRMKLFWNDKKITRDCSWVANKATIQRCKVSGVSNACRLTCGVCSVE